MVARTRGWTRSRNLDVRVGDHRAVLLELRGPVVRDGQRFRGEFRPLRHV